MALKVLLRDRRRGRRREGRALVVSKRRDTYYAGEVTRILKLQNVDYVQLRRLFNLVRGKALTDTFARQKRRHRWRQFNFRDLQALRVATRIVFGVDDEKTRRARISKLKLACDHLRRNCGLKDPLLEAHFTAQGGEIYVRLRGNYFDKTTRQRVFAEVVASVERHERVALREAGVRKVATIPQRANGQKDATAPYLVPALAIQRRRR